MRPIHRVRVLWALLLGLALFSGVSASASASDDHSDEANGDLGLRLGLLFGSITQNNLAVPEQFDYGGFPFGILYTHNFSLKWSIQAGASMVFDVTNIEITCTNFDIAGLYHMMGGSRSLVRDYGGERIVSHEPMNLSLVARMAVESYHATSKAGGPSLAGSAIDIRLGAEYRFDLDEDNSLAFQLTGSAFSLAASAEQLSVHVIDLSGVWRFFL